MQIVAGGAAPHANKVIPSNACRHPQVPNFGKRSTRGQRAYAAARRSTMLLGTLCRAVDAPHETERRFGNGF
jgi:hypothetical protein